MTVSVVIPCYNGMPYLPQALDSALAQTHAPCQVIVVDDGSSDDSAATVQRYAAEYPDRGGMLIQQANAGEPAARNRGIEACDGDWVAMLDTDDWWEPTKLEKQLAAARDAGPECVMVHTGWTYHLADGTTRPCDLARVGRRIGWCTQRLLEPTSTGHPSIMVRRDVLKRIGGYDTSFKQACDIDLYFRLSAEGSFAFVPEYLLNYRYHAQQMSSAKFTQLTYHFRAIEKFMAEHEDIVGRIGRQRFVEGMADQAAVKLESFYWQRRFDDFHQLLRYCDEHKRRKDASARWRRRGRWPRWIIWLKDRLTGAGA